MKIKKNAFSLIEVIIATSIITISVFGVYKLIGENTKIINKSGNFTQVEYLFPIIRECIEYLGFENFKIDTLVSYNFNLGNDLNLCKTGSLYNITLDEINYYVSGNITNSGSDFIEWELIVSSDEINTITGSYLQYKN